MNDHAGTATRWTRISAGLLVAALAAACTSDGDADDDAAAAAELGDGVTELEEELGFEDVVAVEVSSDVVGPGETVTVTVAAAPAALTADVHGPEGLEGSFDVPGGSGQIAVPADAPDGVRTIDLAYEGATLGVATFRVASEPGLWLQADRRYAAPDGSVTMRVVAHDIPPDSPAFIIAPADTSGDSDPGVGADPGTDDEARTADPDDGPPPGTDDPDGDLDDLDLDDLDVDFDDLDIDLDDLDFGDLDLDMDFDDFADDWFEDDEDWDGDEEGVGIFTVHEAGTLVPLGPTTLTPGTMPTVGDLAGRSFDVPVRLSRLGALQVIAAESTQTAFAPGGGRWHSNAVTVYACDEPGAVRGATSGPAMVHALSRETGTVRSAEADGAFELEAGPGAVAVIVEPMDGADPPEPDIVEVGCGQRVELAGGPAATVAMAAATTGQPSFELAAALGGAGEDVCRNAYVITLQSTADSDVIDRFAGRAALTLRGALPRVRTLTEWDIRMFLHISAHMQLNPDRWHEEEAQDWARGAGRELNDMDYLVDLRVRETRDLGFTLFLNAMRLQPPVSVRTTFDRAPERQDLLESDTFAEVAAGIATSGVCGEVEPTDAHVVPDEEIDLTVTVTDLAGGDADGAEVTVSPATPECGDLHPSDDLRVEGRTLELVYEATARQAEECVDELRFKATWPDGDPQPVETYPVDPLDTTIRVGGDFRVEMDFGIDPEAILEHVPVFLLFEAELEAEACGGGILGPWDGTFDIDFQLMAPFLGADEVEGGIAVGFELPENGGTFHVQGLDEIGFVGEYYAGGDVIALLSDGMPLMVGDIEPLEEGQGC